MTEKPVVPEEPLSEDEESLLSLVDDRRDELTRLVRDLVSIDSVTSSAGGPGGSDKIVGFVEARMKEWGFETRRFGSAGASNLIAGRNGDAPGKTLQFCGHLDTVPFNSVAWNRETPPLSGVIKDGRLYGRGAVDMKAGIACQMTALRILTRHTDGFRGRVRLWCTPDEEIHGPCGSAWMPYHHPEAVAADATIIGEPTVVSPLQSPGILAGEKGPLWLRLTFHGVSGHGSRTNDNNNALYKAARFITGAKRRLKVPVHRVPLSPLRYTLGLLNRYRPADLLRWKFSGGRRGARLKQVFRTTWSFNALRADSAVNVIPDTCRLDMDCRLMPGLSSGEFLDALARYCGALGYRVRLPEEPAADDGSPMEGCSIGVDAEPPTDYAGDAGSAVDVEVSVLTRGEGFYISGRTDFQTCLEHSFEAVYGTAPVHVFTPGFTDAGNLREAGFQDVFVVGPGGGRVHGADEYVNVDSLVPLVKLYLLTAYRFLR